MTVKLDYTAETVVVWCDLCPSFAELATDRLGAWREGAAHEERVHPSFRQARQALYATLQDCALSGVDTAPDDLEREAS